MPEEFTTGGIIEVRVDQRSLREAEREIESELGDVAVGVDPGGSAAAMADGAGGVGDATNALDDLEKLADERNEILNQILDELEECCPGGGGGGDLPGLRFRGRGGGRGGGGLRTLAGAGATVLGGVLAAGAAGVTLLDGGNRRQPPGAAGAAAGGVAVGETSTTTGSGLSRPRVVSELGPQSSESPSSGPTIIGPDQRRQPASDEQLTPERPATPETPETPETPGTPSAPTIEAAFGPTGRGGGELPATGTGGPMATRLGLLSDPSRVFGPEFDVATPRRAPEFEAPRTPDVGGPSELPTPSRPPTDTTPELPIAGRGENQPPSAAGATLQASARDVPLHPRDGVVFDVSDKLRKHPIAAVAGIGTGLIVGGAALSAAGSAVSASTAASSLPSASSVPSTVGSAASTAGSVGGAFLETIAGGGGASAAASSAGPAGKIALGAIGIGGGLKLTEQARTPNPLQALQTTIENLTQTPRKRERGGGGGGPQQLTVQNNFSGLLDGVNLEQAIAREVEKAVRQNESSIKRTSEKTVRKTAEKSARRGGASRR